MKKIFAIVTSIVMALGVVFAGEPAQADQADKVKQIIEKLAPGILSQTNSAELLNVTKLVEGSQKKGIRLSSLSSDTKTRISMTVAFASNIESKGLGLSVLSGEDDAIRAVTQPTVNGFRVLTTLTSSPKSNRFDFKFELPTSFGVQTTPNGFLVTAGSQVLGSLAKPWAIDGEGQSLRTHFEWDGSLLTQVLDENLSTIQYPVVMDPAWGYTYQYNLVFRASTNMSRLKTCFNCYFPVAGAPRDYPKFGQLLPLQVAVFNFECTMGQTIQTPDYASFQFNATRNHIDGFGSNIIFQFIRVDSKNVLVVDAYIVNSLDLIRGIYKPAAALNWQTFASNLNSPTPRT